MKKKLILRNFLSPGDIVMLTAAVRDLHRCYPNRFVTDVRTSCTPLWDNNPYLTPLSAADPRVEVIDCEYPLINSCNETPYHCLHGFIKFLNDRLGLEISPTAFKGDIHISDLEKSWSSQVHELTGRWIPFWVVAAGGKYDLTIKWWQTERYQEVVEHFRGRIQFVQVGSERHHHPTLDGVIDLRGRTDLRQLVRLVYHSQGVLCPVTSLMHLAAAIEVKGGKPRNRPCVVVAGGREPVHWEAYPHHQFIHTSGALPCCQQGGCWRSRTHPLGDGDERDKDLCIDVAGDLPRCMAMIEPAEVIRRIETYFEGGMIRFLSPAQGAAAKRAISATHSNPLDDQPLHIHNARLALDQFLKSEFPCPANFGGRGIVICATGSKDFSDAWVSINLLRHLGCTLAIELWHRARHAFIRKIKPALAALNVTCVDVHEISRSSAWNLGESELKPYALLHSSFREVLLLEARNIAVVDPEYLFETAQFRETGAIFWPDRGTLGPFRFLWRLCGIPHEDESEFHAGQIMVDKEKCWKALKLAMWFNEHSDFFFRYIRGEKEIFHLAFRKLNQGYSMPGSPMRSLDGANCQHDFEGNRIFQHRTPSGWNLSPTNKKIEDFWFETEGRSWLKQWHKMSNSTRTKTLIGVEERLDRIG